MKVSSLLFHHPLRLTDDWSDVGLHNMEGINNLRKKQPGLKTILSFGGWTESQSGIYAVGRMFKFNSPLNTVPEHIMLTILCAIKIPFFQRLASDPSKRATFVRTAWELANK